MDRASIIAIEEVCKRCHIYAKHCGMLEYPSQCVDSGHFIDGYRKAEKDLGWHSVDECLPEIDEEVIVLTQVPAFGKISFAHLVNSDVMITIDGKPYKPEAYSGWNIPGVKYWMPMPKLPEE